MTPHCQLCHAPLTQSFIDLGTMPLANSYLSESDLARPEPRYPLHARVCGTCFLVQVDRVVPPDHIFSDYAYFSSYSSSWVEHARRYADMAIRRFGLGRDSKVLEVASNDGYLLQHFVKAGVPVLGIEPAANVAAVAEERGVPSRVAFFGKALGEALGREGHAADLIVANNVMAHVPDLDDFIAGFAAALKPDGVMTAEFPHFLNLMREVQFDTIYHEHFSYLSLLPVERALGQHGLRLFDVEKLSTHGGSLRIYACRTESRHREQPGLAAIRADEAAAGLGMVATYRDFQGKVESIRDGFRRFLASAGRGGASIVAYGAAAKGNTFLNYCGVGVADIAYVVDRSPHKQGRFLPGSHIPIHAPERIAETRPGYVLILPWNLRQEIARDLAFIGAWGGQCVIAVPRVDIFAPGG
ncbi:MAG: class I SAM-dependent methyltransferase [Alphaproteobacteria bacterium]